MLWSPLCVSIGGFFGVKTKKFKKVTKKLLKCLVVCNFIVTFALSNQDKRALLTIVMMKYNELYRKLRKAGCFLLRHGGSHDIWVNPKNGNSVSVPRHGTEEVLEGTLKSIYRRLGL